MTIYVYIAQSMDGYIAEKDGGIDWLEEIPAPEGDDLGFSAFMSQIDALVMGRNTFEVVHGFGMWPYTKPVYVISATLQALPDEYDGKAAILNLPPEQIVTHLQSIGKSNLYVDGGALIQSFLREDLIDEMIITTIPVLLGGGIPLFGSLPEPFKFTHHKTEVLIGALVKTHYKRQR